MTPPAAIPLPPLPELLRYLWTWAVELIDGSAADGFMPVQVTWRDVAAWAAMTGAAPEPWEARVLIRIGAEYTASRMERRTGRHG